MHKWSPRHDWPRFSLYIQPPSSAYRDFRPDIHRRHPSAMAPTRASVCVRIDVHAIQRDEDEPLCLRAEPGRLNGNPFLIHRPNRGDYLFNKIGPSRKGERASERANLPRAISILINRRLLRTVVLGLKCTHIGIRVYVYTNVKRAKPVLSFGGGETLTEEYTEKFYCSRCSSKNYFFVERQKERGVATVTAL